MIHAHRHGGAGKLSMVEWLIDQARIRLGSAGKGSLITKAEWCDQAITPKAIELMGGFAEATVLMRGRGKMPAALR